MALACASQTTGNTTPRRFVMDVGRFGALEELSSPCRCGVDPAAHHFTLESVAYCRHCAAALVGSDVAKPGSFEIL
jgi:hypothetical protein